MPTVDLAASYQIHPRLALSARVSNVLDADYETFGLLGDAEARPFFKRAIEAGTKPETEIKIKTPIIGLSKAEIVRKGIELDAPLALSWSCYRSETLACGTCDSCALRLRGFARAGVEDPIEYERN